MFAVCPFGNVAEATLLRSAIDKRDGWMVKEMDRWVDEWVGGRMDGQLCR
jgi:hypothetical protein